MSPVPLPELGVFGIDIFFVISGFILTSSIQSAQAKGPLRLGEFVSRRAIRIYPMYWLVALLGAVHAISKHQTFGAKYLPGLFLAPLNVGIYPNTVNGAWTLVFEVFFYSILCLSIACLPKHAILATVVTLCTLALVGSVTSVKGAFTDVAFNGILLEFVFGCLLALGHRSLQRFHQFRWACLALGTLLAVGLRWYGFSCANGMQMVLAGTLVPQRVFSYGIAATFIVGGVTLFRWKPASRAGALGVLLGNASYSIYLFAEFPLSYSLGACAAMFDHPLRLTGPELALFCCVSMGCVLASSLAVYLWVERPCLRALNRVLASYLPPARPAPGSTGTGSLPFCNRTLTSRLACKQELCRRTFTLRVQGLQGVDVDRCPR